MLPVRIFPVGIQQVRQAASRARVAKIPNRRQLVRDKEWLVLQLKKKKERIHWIARLQPRESLDDTEQPPSPFCHPGCLQLAYLWEGVFPATKTPYPPHRVDVGKLLYNVSVAKKRC
jgi:hypothetical protein